MVAGASGGLVGGWAQYGKVEEATVMMDRDDPGAGNTRLCLWLRQRRTLLNLVAAVNSIVLLWWTAMTPVRLGGRRRGAGRARIV